MDAKANVSPDPPKPLCLWHLAQTVQAATPLGRGQSLSARAVQELGTDYKFVPSPSLLLTTPFLSIVHHNLLQCRVLIFVSITFFFSFFLVVIPTTSIVPWNQALHGPHFGPIPCNVQPGCSFGCLTAHNFHFIPLLSQRCLNTTYPSNHS